jgi:KaiC/GvpD/RAD55 family RecA-like ATPase
MSKKRKTTVRKQTGKGCKPGKVAIRNLPTGISGLDPIMGGGMPEYSCNIIAGGPGCGKTTMAHQFVFANATPRRPALYFTILGESPIKMLRYQQQYTFFDLSKLNGTIRFINLSQVGYTISFLADDIIRLRYLDLDSQLTRILSVIKMRDSQHSKDICEYEITKKGLVLSPASASTTIAHSSPGFPRGGNNGCQTRDQRNEKRHCERSFRSFSFSPSILKKEHERELNERNDA